MLSTPSLKADLPKVSYQTAGMTCYSKEEIGKLADFKKECDLTKMNLEAMEKAYEKAKEQGETKWWQDTTSIVSFSFGSFMLGFLAASLSRR